MFYGDRLGLLDSAPICYSEDDHRFSWQGASVWEPFPDVDCAWLHCLWSETEQSNIDLWLEPFTLIRQGRLSVRGACPRPKGGQTGQGTQAPAAVAFVVTMYNNGLTAAQCLLELFRCGKSACAASEALLHCCATLRCVW